MSQENNEKSVESEEKEEMGEESGKVEDEDAKSESQKRTEEDFMGETTFKKRKWKRIRRSKEQLKMKIRKCRKMRFPFVKEKIEFV